MAEKLDVATRSAEGWPAVDNIQTYVWACHVLGYANPDLTLHASQVRDWYASQDGPTSGPSMPTVPRSRRRSLRRRTR